MKRTFNTQLKKRWPILSSFLLFSFLISAQTASVTQGCVPLLVDFSPPPGLASHFWEFQNGATSVEANPAAVFSQPDTYNVTLREIEGGEIVGTVSITVYPKPQIDIAVDTDVGCIPFDVNFTNSSSIDPGITVDQINWVFGDGEAAGGNAPAHTYQMPGVYTVSMSVASSLEGCTTTANFPDFVQVGGVEGVNFLTFPFPAVSCEPPLEVFFFNHTEADVDFVWDLGNGTTHEGVVPPPETYTEPGVFPVTLTATDELGCTGEKTRFVEILALGNLIPDSVCIWDSLFYETWESADEVTWEFPTASEVGEDLLGRPFVVFDEPGFHTINYTATNLDPLCSLDSVFMIYVDQVIADFESAPSYTCENSLEIDFSATSPTATAYQWLFVDGEFDSGANVTHTYTYVDTMEFSMNGLIPYFTTLLASNPLGCRDTIIYPDTIFVPNALIMTDVTEGCVPLEVMIFDSSASFEPIVEWHIDYGDGESATFTEPTDHSHTYTEPGEYSIVLNILNEAGCLDTSYARIIYVGEMLEYDFDIQPQEICIGDPLELIIIDPPEEAEWWELTDPAFTLVAEYNGCFTEKFKEIPIITNGPAVDMEWELFCEDPHRVFFTSEVFDITGIEWNFGDGTMSTELNPVHVYDEPGDYVVTVTVYNDNGDCPPASEINLICIRDIEANFEVPEHICEGELTILDASQSDGVVTSTCMNGVGYTWYFEENGRPIQTGQTTAFQTFSTLGPDVVTLIVKDVNGCRDTISQEVTVFGIEALSTVSDDFICFPTTVDFFDQSTSDTTIVNWLWEFGDNTISTEEMNTSHVYTQPAGIPVDTFLTTLTVTNAIGCTESFDLPILTYEPVSDIIPLPSANVCVGETVVLSATDFTAGGSQLSYVWDLGVFGTNEEPSVSITVTESGTFPVTLNYTEVASGCMGEDLLPINVQSYPTAEFSSDADGMELLCYPTQIQFTDESTSEHNLSYQWNFGNDQLANDPNPQSAFDKGIYTVELAVQTSFGCADTITQTFTFVGPEGAFSFGPPLICQGEAVTFTLQDTLDVSSFSWDFGDGIVLDDVNPIEHVYSDLSVLGYRPVSLILRGVNDQCVLAITDSLFIHEVQADFQLNETADSILCAGTYDLINLSSGADIYEWILPNGEMSNMSEPSVTLSPGNYTFNLAVANEEFGCTDTLSKIFTLVNLPEVALVPDSICIGDTTVLHLVDVVPNSTYSWSPEEFVLGSNTIATPTVLVPETTTFQVEVTDSLGCTSSGGGAVFVLEPLPWMDIDTTLCPGDLLAGVLPNLGALYTATWFPSPPPDSLGNENLNLGLTISDVLGCYEDGYDFDIESLTDQLEIPNIFSPNGDGTNDIFKVFSAIDFARTDLIQIETFRVYNRWGQKIYDGAGPDAQWDGTYRGKDAPSDVYIYYILVDVPKSGSRYELKGEVTLIR